VGDGGPSPTVDADREDGEPREDHDLAAGPEHDVFRGATAAVGQHDA